MFQNEALSSVTAKERLSQSSRNYDKSEVDAVAAAVILETFIESNMDRIKQLV
jgi:RNase H-fold protein (predicted Holliday junction resolvase)